MSHPVLKRKENILAYFSVWAIVAVLHALILVGNQHLEWSWAVRDSLVFNTLFSAFALGIWYTCQYTSPATTPTNKILLTHVFAATLVILMWLGAGYYIMMKTLPPDHAYGQFLRTSLIWRTAVGLLLYIVMIAFYYMFIYAENLHKQELREAELQTLVKDAELRSLKFQINPHFIFNSLNSIYSLTMTAPQKAGEMTTKLSDFLRYSLTKSESQTSSLREEIRSVRTYLEIERVRFGDKIRYSENIDEACLQASVPSMLLQPLFENAIKHGVYESLEPVPISFSCSPQNDFLRIVVENTFDPEATGRKGEGIGLQNIRYRLQKLYNRTDLLDISKKDNLFRVSIKIPVEA